MILRRFALAAALVALVAAPVLSSDVVMGRYDPYQSSYTSEKIDLPIALKWEFTGNRFKNNPAAPIVVGKTCYFASGEFVYAVDLDTGGLNWKYPSERGLGGSVKSTPVYHAGNLFFGATDKNLYCLDAATGAFKWAYPVRGGIRCSPVITEGVLYFGADDDSVHAISPDTGEAVWPKPFTAKDDISTGLAVAPGILIAASMDACVYGVSTVTGKLRTMPFRLPQAPVRTSPVIVDNVVVMAVGNSMLGISLRGNQLRWQVTLPSEAAATPAALGNDVFVPCRDKNIYAYNIGGRQPILKWTAPAELGTVPLASPVAANDTIYVTGSRGVIAAFSANDGSLKWRYVCSPSTITAPTSAYVDIAASATVANGAVLVLSDDGVLRCFTADAPDYEPPKAFRAVPTVGSVLSSAPPIKISCVLFDIGSGVDFSKVSMRLDDVPVENLNVDPATFTVSYVTDVGSPGKPMQRLPQGPHTATVYAQDYKGNLLTHSWFFLTDDSLPPPRVAVPAAQSKKTTVPPKTKTETPKPTYPPGFPGGQNVPAPPPPPAPPPTLEEPTNPGAF